MVHQQNKCLELSWLTGNDPQLKSAPIASELEQGFLELNFIVGTVFSRKSQSKKFFRKSGNRSENECGQHVVALRQTATASGLMIRQKYLITIRGSSPASILQVHSLHHAAASTPFHAIIGQHAKIITISSIFSVSFCFLEQFRIRNLHVLQSERFKA